MNKASRASKLAQIFGSGIVVQKKLRARQRLGDGLRFLGDVRGARVGHAENQRWSAGICRSLLAESKNAGAGSIGDGESLIQVMSAIVEGMERKIVQ